MDEIWKGAKGILGAVAPTIATALGGPLAGQAVSFVMSALGLAPDASPDAAVAALKTASPEQLLALKQADQQFAARMKELDIDLERIAAGDRDSARQREVAVKDWIPGLLGIFAIVSFISWIAAVTFLPQHLMANENIVMLAFAKLDGLATAVILYYFGSSSSSARKDALLAQAPPR